MHLFRSLRTSIFTISTISMKAFKQAIERERIAWRPVRRSSRKKRIVFVVGSRKRGRHPVSFYFNLALLGYCLGAVLYAAAIFGKKISFFLPEASFSWVFSPTQSQ